LHKEGEQISILFNLVIKAFVAYQLASAKESAADVYRSIIKLGRKKSGRRCVVSQISARGALYLEDLSEPDFSLLDKKQV
jgi:hypothetical protein